MKNLSIPAAAIALAVFTASALHAETTKITREFRPLEAKRVVFAPSAKVEANGIDSILSAAWGHFDQHEWDQAIDKFLTVMEQDTKNAPAAEGLAMSVYRSGDYKAAYRLSSEFASFMPEISDKIAAVVLADVRSMVHRGKNTEARRLLGHFPQSDLAFAHAHTLVDGAETLAKNVGPDGELPNAKLAKN